ERRAQIVVRILSWASSRARDFSCYRSTEFSLQQTYPRSMSHVIGPDIFGPTAVYPARARRRPLMNKLLAEVLDAHGGVDRWREYAKVDATIVSGGGFFALKGFMPDPNPRRMTVWLHEERSSVTPYGAADQRTMFTPDRIAIEKLDGTLIAERRAPRD